jgi:hypothetical protein
MRPQDKHGSIPGRTISLLAVIISTLAGVGIVLTIYAHYWAM